MLLRRALATQPPPPLATSLSSAADEMNAELDFVFGSSSAPRDAAPPSSLLPPPPPSAPPPQSPPPPQPPHLAGDAEVGADEEGGEEAAPPRPRPRRRAAQHVHVHLHLGALSPDALRALAERPLRIDVRAEWLRGSEEKERE